MHDNFWTVHIVHDVQLVVDLLSAAGKVSPYDDDDNNRYPTISQHRSHFATKTLLVAVLQKLRMTISGPFN